MNNGKIAVLPSERNIFLKKWRHFSKDEAQEISQCPISCVQPLPPVWQPVLGDPACFTSITITSIFILISKFRHLFTAVLLSSFPSLFIFKIHNSEMLLTSVFRFTVPSHPSSRCRQYWIFHHLTGPLFFFHPASQPSFLHRNSNIPPAWLTFVSVNSSERKKLNNFSMWLQGLLSAVH